MKNSQCSKSEIGQEQYKELTKGCGAEQGRTYHGGCQRRNLQCGGGTRVWCGGVSESIRINLGIAQQAEGYQGMTEQLCPILNIV
jgi:hypothetical protein